MNNHSSSTDPWKDTEIILYIRDPNSFIIIKFLCTEALSSNNNSSNQKNLFAMGRLDW